MPGTRTPGRRLTLRQGHNAPRFCFDLYDAETGESVAFVQSDWNYPSLAQSCGWSLREVNKQRECEHGGTDGTIDCPECNTKVTEFLSAAYDWLAANDGSTFEVHDYGNNAAAPG